ncbi:MAG: exodeoxyribonuclease VII large subunit [bacterium]|nr:exodeoxyribonuclease VII large subunit [bacterium]
MKPEFFTVSEYLDLLNTFLRRELVRVVGEIVEYKPGARWVGFTIKDKKDDSIMKCVVSAWEFKRIGVRIDVGMEVKVTGAPSISKKYSSFGFWAKHIEPIGEGALRQAYELLFKQLKEEGLFERKRSLPLFTKRIGVVSSREGVVIHDFMNNLKPLGFEIVFVDSRVEGEHAPLQLISAIQLLESKNPDVIILIRGGGSLESMQAFNNEGVCRAIYACAVPVLVGIGHDVDVPIACLVADVSASTPTAVAHSINETWAPLIEGLPRLAHRLERTATTLLSTTMHTIERASRQIVRGYQEHHRRYVVRLGSIDTLLLKVFHRLFGAVRTYDERLSRGRLRFSRCMADVRQRVDQCAGVLAIGMSQMLHRFHERSFVAWRVIDISNPERNLARGYSIVFDRGSVVRSITTLKKDAVLTTRVHDGTIESRIEKLKKDV